MSVRAKVASWPSADREKLRKLAEAFTFSSEQILANDEEEEGKFNLMNENVVLE